VGSAMRVRCRAACDVVRLAEHDAAAMLRTQMPASERESGSHRERGERSRGDERARDRDRGREREDRDRDRDRRYVQAPRTGYISELKVAQLS